ncbi:MAG: hypothetical protein KDI68_09870 [Gammaproteobacteria bacterium]|nr:hypothetical protein [Gammaproteobacteria bacterium]
MKRKTVKKRLRKCLQCRHLRFRKSFIWKQCRKCGCLVELKARLPSASCPKGKW